MTPQSRVLLTVLLLLATSELPAQSSGPLTHDTTLAPGPQYAAGGLHRFLLGSEYRSLWTTPVSAPVLDLRRFAGGLRPVSKGGGKQTKSLLLAASDGRQFFFRSVDKDASAILPEELRGTVAGEVVRDQTSSAFPTAPPVVGRLLTAAGILHAEEILVVLPRDPILGEFETEFAGTMGFLQERIGGAEGAPDHWNRASEIIGTDSLLARVTRSPDDRAHARAFLAARLFDVWIGDWDRHRDQWVWARFGNQVPRRWVPIPRDRDQAFAKYDGILFGIARQSAPQLTNFGPDYPYLPGATWNGRDLDRRFLVELDWPVWDSVAQALQSRLTDSAIAHAVRALPPEHYRLSGERLAASLRARRDALVEAAGRFYRLLAEQVDVHATEAADYARLTTMPDGKLLLTMSHAAQDSAPFFSRRFEARNTSEIRIFLEGGDDTAVVRGTGSRILGRVLGGDGRDLLVDSTSGGREKFYDDPAAPPRTSGFAHEVERKPYVPPPIKPGEVPPREWGHRWALNGWGAFGPDLGALVGGSATLTSYGFRKHPFASRHRFRAGFATGPSTYRLDYRGELRRENSATYTELLLRASGIDVINFHGFGNEIAAPGDQEFYRVTQDAFTLAPSLVLSLGERSTLRLGPSLKYVSTDDRPGRFLGTLGDLYGTDSFGEIGGGMTFRFDSRDRANAATRGLVFELGGTLYPPLWDVDSTFGEVHGVAATYLSPRAPLDPTLALRIGGQKLWGAFPYFEAAFIGDASTVRLGRVNRYAGDASLYGSAELRVELGQVQIVLPAHLGVFGLADAGRVFLEGESSDEWHTAFGGGVWLAFLNRAYALSLAAASSEERTGIYVQGGFAF